ncbi:Ig-like domain-containing protein [Patescibacteria group bacterium]|nr:Ig-like domain-containing protein [Patescibacteria group bacterium]
MNKLLILTLMLAILVVGSMLLFSLFGPKKTPQPTQPVIQATITPSPPLLPITTTETLTLISINPQQDLGQTYFPIKQIFFTFSEPMNPATFQVETSPDTKVVTTLKPGDSNTIVVSPQDIWPQGITTITVLPSTTSVAGNKLVQPVVYKINTKFPDNPPPDSPGL